MMELLAARVLIIVISISNIPCSATDTVKCTSVPECICSTGENNTLVANCSGLQLRSVPTFSSEVVAIDLSHNNIEMFPKDGELPINLTALDISNNKIRDFHQDSFKNLSHLRELNLASNKLCLNDHIFIPELFKATSLRVLNLKRNCDDSSVEQYYPNRTFEYLTKLEDLSIDGLENNVFKGEFTKLTNLKRLDLSGKSGKCSLRFLTPRVFANLHDLETLDVSACKLVRIESGTLRHIKHLTYFDMSFNEDLTFAVLQNVTCDLQSTSIKVLKFNQIHQMFGAATEIRTADIRCLKNTLVEEIYMDTNRLELLEPGAITYLPQTLRYYSATDNKFTFGHYFYEINQMKGLQEFNGSFQHTSHNPKELVQLNQANCDQQGNCIETQDTRRYLPSNQGSVGLEKVKNMALHKASSKAPFPPNLERIYFKKSVLQYDIPKLVMPVNRVRVADFSDNMLYRWTGPVTNLQSLEYLDLSSNHCYEVSVRFFHDVKHLKTLYIGNNVLGTSFQKDTEGQIFSKLKNLKILDVSINHIQDLPSNIFHGLKKLEILNISNNALRVWHVEIRHMKYLQRIDLGSNQLIEMPLGLRSALDQIAVNGNISINIENNNLICNCETLNFLLWITHTKVNFENLNTYNCQYTTGIKRSFKDIEIIKQDLNFDCKIKWAIINVLSVVGAMSLVSITAFCIYRYRWKLLLKYYSLKMRYRRQTRFPNLRYKRYENILQDDADDGYTYDVYLIYDDTDLEFVHEIEKELSRSQIRVCILDRDLMAGYLKYESICKAIQLSRKSLIVLSNDFMDNEECMFQYRLALTENTNRANGTNLIRMIDYKHVPAKTTPLDMLNLRDLQLSIDYPDKEPENAAFWEKLRKRLLE